VLLLPEEESGSQSETRAQLDIPAIRVVKVVIRSAIYGQGKPPRNLTLPVNIIPIGLCRKMQDPAVLPNHAFNFPQLAI